MLLLEILMDDIPASPLVGGCSPPGCSNGCLQDGDLYPLVQHAQGLWEKLLGLWSVIPEPWHVCVPQHWATLRRLPWGFCIYQGAGVPPQGSQEVLALDIQNICICPLIF